MYCNGSRIGTTSDFPSNSPNSTINDYPLTIGARRMATAWDHKLSTEAHNLQISMFDTQGVWQGGSSTNLRSHYRPTEFMSSFQLNYDTENEAMVRPFTGSIDEVRIYNQALTSQSIAIMSSSITNTNIVGNIFYDYGIATVTDPRPRYRNMFTDTDKFYVAFKGTHTLYESEYLCHIRSEDYELSMNPTLRSNNSPLETTLKGMASSSQFSPYITTVGLYNDNFDLVAIAKLAAPLKKPKNMDTTIVVRFDT